MSEASAPSKICILCGQDCSHKPRTKDKQGRYSCEECVARAKAARGAGAANGAPPVTCAGPQTAATPPDDDGTIPFLDEQSVSGKPAMVVCPNCARPLDAAAVICMGCGFNRATGRNVSTALEDEPAGAGKGGRAKGKGKGKGKTPARACRTCGYDMAGLESLTCPKCGTVNTRPTRRDRDREDSRRVTRNAWLQPIIMTVVGLAISTLIVAVARGEIEAVAHLILFAVSLVIGLIVYIMCSVLWIGFDEPLPMTALRLMGVYALADIGFTLVGLVPMAGFGIMGFGMWTAPTIIYFLLLSHIMELDIEDAVIVAVITSILKIFTVMFIAAKLAGVL